MVNRTTRTQQIKHEIRPKRYSSWMYCKVYKLREEVENTIQNKWVLGFAVIKWCTTYIGGWHCLLPRLNWSNYGELTMVLYILHTLSEHFLNFLKQKKAKRRAYDPQKNKYFLVLLRPRQQTLLCPSVCCVSHFSKKIGNLPKKMELVCTEFWTLKKFREG